MSRSSALAAGWAMVTVPRVVSPGFSRTVRRVSYVVPRLRYSRPAMGLVKSTSGAGWRRGNARGQPLVEGSQLAEVIATRRPPGRSARYAAATWRRSVPLASFEEPADRENGGFMTTTLGCSSGNRSAMFSASWRLTSALGNARCSRPARVLASSLSAQASAGGGVQAERGRDGERTGAG